MKKSSLFAAAALSATAAMLLAGCAGSGGGTPTSSGDAGGKRACVILPDSASSNRWEDFDRKYLQEGLEAAGFEADIQNAQGDVQKFATIADQQLTKGCGVMLLVDYQGAARASPRRPRRRTSRSSPTTVRSPAPTTTCRSTT